MTTPSSPNAARNLASLIVAAVVIIGAAVAVVAWKGGWLADGTGTPTNANGAAIPDGSAGVGDHDSKNQVESHQRLDESLDAASQYVNAEQLGAAERILEALQKEHPRHPRVLAQLYELRLFQKDYTLSNTRDAGF